MWIVRYHYLFCECFFDTGGRRYSLFQFEVPESSYTEGCNMLLQNYSSAEMAAGKEQTRSKNKQTASSKGQKMLNVGRLLASMKKAATADTEKSEETLLLVILDECHSGATVNTVFHQLCNEQAMMKLDNFVVLIISATPYNNRR
jgi:Type III restriction enzyme, res subunit